MTNTELEIMRDAMTYLGAHNQPPPTGTEEAVVWWTEAAEDLGAVAGKWENHPLATAILMALYEYIEGKARKEAVK